MKPLTLEEAKANIGKEVVYIGENKEFANTMNRTILIDGLNMKGNAVVVRTDTKEEIYFVVHPEHIALKQPLKIGDTVKLDPSTKPYTQLKDNGDMVENLHQNPIREYFKIFDIHEDGDIDLHGYGYIHPRHLIKVKEKTMTANQLIKRNTVQDATCIGVKSKLFSIVLDETRFLWINNQWIECHSIDDDFETVTIGIDTGDGESKSVSLNLPNGSIIHGKLVNSDEPQYTPEEVELRERIAFKLLEVDKYTYPDLCAVYNAITGK